jgi:hypothetical protein
MLFVPQPRLVWRHFVEGQSSPDGLAGGGIPGLPNPFPALEPNPEPSEPGASWWRVVVQPSSWHSGRWSLFNQNWTTQLTPATAEHLNFILSTAPYVHGDLEGLELPALDNLSARDVRWLNHH